MTNQLNKSPPKHTPGPWVMIGGSIVTDWKYGEHLWVCSVYGALVRSKHEANANADLIATAPELLEALETIIDRGDVDSIFQKQTLAQARAAIAKARGQQ